MTHVEVGAVVVSVEYMDGHCSERTQRRLSHVDRGHYQMVNVGQFSVQSPAVQLSSQSVDVEIIRRRVA